MVMKETHPPLIPPSLVKRGGQGVEFIELVKSLIKYSMINIYSTKKIIWTAVYYLNFEICHLLFSAK